MMVTRGMLVFRKCISGYRDSSLPSRSFPRSADSEGWRRLFLRNVRILLHSCLWDIADHCSLASFVGSRNGLSEAESLPGISIPVGGPGNENRCQEQDMRQPFQVDLFCFSAERKLSGSKALVVLRPTPPAISLRQQICFTYLNIFSNDLEIS